MPNYKKEIRSGDVIEIEFYFSPRKIGKSIPRSKNINLTASQQIEANFRRARKNLSRLINANFNKRDMHITLTYRDAPSSIEEAQKLQAKFTRRLRKKRRDLKLPELKWIAVTEGGHDEEFIKKHKRLNDHDPRIHHHMIISGGVTLEALQEMWEYGVIIVSMLSSEGDYTGLAHYITKEPMERHKKRWSQSRNLVKPKVTIKEIMNPRYDIKAPKGYTVRVKETYYSELTGTTQYLKAIRNGGVDVAEGKGLLKKLDKVPEKRTTKERARK